MSEEIKRVAAEVAARFRLKQAQVSVAIELLRENNSVPFIVRYRKRETAGMKAAALRQLQLQLAADAERTRYQEQQLKHQPKSNAKISETKVDASILAYFREKLWVDGVISSVVLSDKKPIKSSKKPKKHAKNNISKLKWSEYVYDKAPLQSIPARRLHLLFRGRRDKALALHLAFQDVAACETYLAAQLKDESKETIQTLWETKIFPQVEVDILARLRTRSDDEMIYGIEKQLQSVLLAPKAAAGVVMGLYADRRMSGLGIAVIDEHGALLDTSTLHPLCPDFRRHNAITVLAKYIATYQIKSVGIGNGPHFQAMKVLLAGFQARYPDMPITSCVVDEAGMQRNIGVLPGAASIARRLHNPLLELLNVPTNQMQFGDVQDEVNPRRLARALTGVIEDTVNRIGVDVNTAPVALLRYISGFDLALAKTVVEYREKNTVFQTREALKQVPGMDSKCFEQSAGFLRVPNGDNALDMTRMHPNDYALLDTLDTRPPDEQRYLDALRLPWTDLKSVVKQPVFNPEITKIQDLKPNMMLEGVVTRMTSFGAFIDIGIYPLGLLHISALAERFVRDPHEILYVGDVVRVTVLQVDAAKHRIALGMKAQAKPAVLLEAPKKKRKNKEVKDAHVPVLVNTAMADAFAKLKPGLS